MLLVSPPLPDPERRVLPVPALPVPRAAEPELPDRPWVRPETLPANSSIVIAELVTTCRRDQHQYDRVS